MNLFTAFRAAALACVAAALGGCAADTEFNGRPDGDGIVGPGTKKDGDRAARRQT
jgi:hypothetical protein